MSDTCAVTIHSGKTIPDGVGGGRRARGQGEFGEDAGDVTGGGAAADEQRLADRPVGVALGQQVEHVQLTR